MPNKRLTNLLKFKNDDELFSYITSTFRDKITTWDYFVNWRKVLDNVSSVEVELNILNYLIGKEDLEKETFGLIKKYPEVIVAFPFLIALRERSIDVLVDVEKFITKKYDFKKRHLTDSEIKDLASFVLKSGFGEMLRDEKLKNLVDYVTGVEVGLDSNGRKNRGGVMMEKISEVFIKDACAKLGLEYLAQASAKKIEAKWGIKIKVDKSSRIIDFVINNKGKMFFIEVNFYGGGGSKLKSTATEYVGMYRTYAEQGIEFIWITDGNGWHSTIRPLREYFDKTNYLLNIELLQQTALKKIISHKTFAILPI